MNREERRRKAKELREVPQGGMGMGQFQAPCGDIIMYMTDIDAKDLKGIRKMAVADHLSKGDCEVPEICANALATDAL